MNSLFASHKFRSINPATGEEFASYPSLEGDALESCLAAAAAAQKQWAASTLATRSAALHAIAARLRAEKDQLGRIITLEMGKTHASAVAEVEKCAMGCAWYADHGPAMLADQKVDMPTGRAVRTFLPLGVILAVMPWNFPLWQVFRFIGPTVMAGNGILLKHASNVPQCAMAIERVVREAGAQAGMPPALMTNLFVDTKTVAGIIADDRVVAVTLTGSERAGMAVAEAAGRALKKCVLELGGSDPFIVLADADIDQAVKVGVHSRMHNNGQSCVCAKRFIVHDAVYDRFEAAFVAATKALRIGDPMDPATEMGPISGNAARDELHGQVGRAIDQGGRVLAGGQKLDGPGWFYAPTVIAGIDPRAPIAQEEFFGPVAMLFRVADRDQALALANDIPFGLGSAVFTASDEDASFFVNGIQAGITAINAMVYSDPRVPFGGVKKSGYGRELADIGMHEFCNIKTVLRA